MGTGTYGAIHRFPNGATQPVEDRLSRKGSKPRELKHLSTWRKRNQTRDPPSSGERKGDSPNRGRLGATGVVGPQCGLHMHSRTLLESWTIAGDSPVYGMHVVPSGILSKAGHVKSCLKMGGPSSKAKY